MKIKHWIKGLTMFGFLALVTPRAEPLQIWISSFQDQVYYESMAELYKEKVDDNFEANVQSFGFREMPDKLAVAVKTGINPPDVVQLDEVLFGAFLSGESPFVDLNDRVKKAGMDKDIIPQRLSLFAYEGKTYGLPQSLSAMVLYYRADLFEEFGIDPKTLTTWERFVEAGRRVKQDHGRAIIALDPTYFGILLRQRGTHWFGKDGKAFPDREAAGEILTWMHDLMQEGLGMVPERASIFDPLFFNGAVTQGEVLSVIGADWYGLDMLQQFTQPLKGKWGIMPLPAWELPDGRLSRRTSSFAGQGLLIYKDSKKIAKAWDFIRFVITDKEANVQRFADGNSFPAYRPAWKDARMTMPSEFFNNQSLGKLLIRLSPEVPTVAVHPNRSKAVFLFQENFFSSLIYGELTPAQVVSRMKEALDGP